MIEAGNGGKHPLIRNIFQTPAMGLSSLIAQLGVNAAHFCSMGFDRRLPRFEQRRHPRFHPRVRVGNASFHHAAHAGLELPQKCFLLGGDLLRQLRACRVELHPRFAK